MRKIKSSKSIAIFVQILILTSLFVSIVIRSWKVGVICSKGDEIVYWERARFLLGQEGASWFTGSSLVSLGYSLILMPICAVIKNPLHAYKAAVFLNGCFLCAGYFVSVKAACKLFPREKKFFLSVVCAFLAYCPVFANSRFYTGPEMILFFLMWMSVYCLIVLSEKYCRRIIFLLTGCMILIGFFDIAYIGVLAAVLALLGVLVKRGKVDETTFLSVVLALLIGLALGNISERFVLAAFCKGKDIIYTSSLEVFLERISKGWENNYVSGVIRGIVGKLYASLVGSFLLICPALWESVKRILKRRKPDVFCMTDGLLLIALVQMVVIALYDNSRAVQNGFTSLDRVSLVLLPVILTGIVRLKESVNWAAEMAGYVLLFCVCTFMTASWYQTSNVTSFSHYNNGILMLFQGNEEAASAVYVAASFIILVTIILFVCLKEKTKWANVNGMLRIFGSMAFAAVFLGMNVFIFRDTVLTDKKNDKVNSFAVASVLSDIPEKGTVYYMAGADGDSKVPKIQALIPEKKIELVKSDERKEFLLSEEWNDENSIIITGSEDSILTRGEEEFTEFRILYLTDNYAIWGHKNGEVSDIVDAKVIDRLETIPLSTVKATEIQSTEAPDPEEELVDATETETESESATELSQETEMESETGYETETGSESETGTEVQSETQTEAKNSASTKKTHTYGKNVILAPGTYHLEVHLRLKEDAENEFCKLMIRDSSGVIADRTFAEDIFDENDQATVGIQFTSDQVMRKVQVVLKGDLLKKIVVEAIYYRKNSSAYTVGLNEENLGSVCDTILKLDQSTGQKGSVAYVGDLVSDVSDLSMMLFESILPEYEFIAVTKENLGSLESDYLIGETESHAYFGAMQGYSIIAREKDYTVLVRNDSLQAQMYLAEGNRFQANGTLLEVSAVNTTNKENRELRLERGTYIYHANIRCQTEELEGNENASAGTLLLYDDKKLIAQKGLMNKDLIPDTTGTAEVTVPFTLRVKSSDLRCEIEMESAADVFIEPMAIELISEKYQYGSDEIKLQNFFHLVNAMGDDVDLYVTQSKSYIKEGQYGLDYLKERMPEARIDVLSYDDASSLTEDGMLLIRGFADDFMDLLDQYSIIGHAGVYTLWVRNDGQLLQRAVSAGAQVYNSGKKISPESLAAAIGCESDGLTLPKDKYVVTLELKVEKLELDDTVEVGLFCDKTEKEIEKEIKELREKGKTLREAEEEVDPQKVCGSATVAASGFSGKDTVIIRVSTNKKMKLANLVCDVYSWHGCNVEGEIVWIEKL